VRASLSFVVAAASLVAAVGLGACGGIGSDSQDVTERVDQPRYLRQAQIEREPEGSPARAFLEWWSSLQFDNPVEVTRYYSRSLGLNARKLEKQLAYGPGGFSFSSAPKIVETIQSGNRATVKVLLTKIVRAPNGRVDKARTGRSFTFRREKGEWRLSDNFYLERLVRQARALEKLLRGTKQGQGAETGDGG
jgi:hypothetical protein